MSGRDTLLATLKERFCLVDFRAGQREVIEAVVSGRSLLAVMPTGAGKSLCYQLPALLETKPTLVISPLIALMKDQVDRLEQLGIPATFINSHVSAVERSRRLQAFESGAYRLVYIAPERLADPHFHSRLKHLKLARVIVDEAHCVSTWGHDFRPEYRAIDDACAHLGVEQVCAFTATATKEVRQDIIDGLKLSKHGAPELFVYGFARDNLMLRVQMVRRMAEKNAAIAHRLRAILHKGSAIIYVATRKNGMRVAAKLRQQGFCPGLYHAGLGEAERSAIQQRFMSGQTPVVVATNAFGMGIDKSNIRLVAHYDLPGSLEAYYQEAGRAGRDGDRAECVIFFTFADVRIHEFFIDKIGEDLDDGGVRRRPLAREQIDRLKELERAKLKQIVSYCYAQTCRHELIVRHFGDRAGRSACETRCDNCAGDDLLTVDLVQLKTGTRSTGRETPNGAVDDDTQFAQKILSAFARARGRLSTQRIRSLLSGRDEDYPADLRRSRSFGILGQVSSADVARTIKALIATGYLIRAQVGEKKNSHYTLSMAGLMLMKGEIRFVVPSVRAVKRSKKRPAPKDVLTDPGAQVLYDQLVTCRKEMAAQSGVPAYVVAGNSLLRKLVLEKPLTESALLEIAGIGPARVARYGAQWLEVIQVHSDRETAPPTPNSG